MKGKEIERRIEEWVKTPEFAKAMEEQAQAAKEREIQARIRQREEAEWWQRIKDQPMTI